MAVEEMYNRARANLGGKMVEQNCSTCEFNYDDICNGYGKRTDNGKDTHGMPMDEAEKMFPNGCDYWDISLDALINQG